MAHDERRYGDTIECSKCGKQWDKDDTDIPHCVRLTIKRWYHEKFTMGILSYNGFNVCVIELPWLNNQVNISCIPEGVYEVFKRVSPSKKYEVIEYRNVPDRSYIQLHYGNFTRQLLGCQAVGDGFKFLDDDDIMDVSNSETTFNKLLDMLPDEFEIEIIS